MLRMVVTALLVAASTQDRYDEVEVSAECAAVLITSSTAVGGAVAYALTPAAICSAGFCSPGVSAASFASWWQSTMPLVAKGSMFAALQSVAVVGPGASITVAGAAVGGAAGAAYLHSFCGFVDTAEPDSMTGRAASVSVKAVQQYSKAKQRASEACAASASCSATANAASAAADATANAASAAADATAEHVRNAKQEAAGVVDAAASLWGRLSTGAGLLADQVAQKARVVQLRAQIKQLEKDVDSQKRDFGIAVFDFMRAKRDYKATIAKVLREYTAIVTSLESKIDVRVKELDSLEPNGKPNKS